MRKLLQTVEKTIKHYEGEIEMKDSEIYQGFNSKKQKEYERYLIANYGTKAKELYQESLNNVKDWKESDWENYKNQSNQLNNELVEALKNNLAADSKEVQRLIKRHFVLIQNFYEPSREVYEGLADFYLNHAEIKKFYEDYYEGLAEFVSKGVKVFAKENLV